MAKNKQPKKYPSRIRYEQANPTISFRLPRETRSRLESQMQALGWSPADWVKNHLDQNDRLANARAESLSRQRDGLGRDIEAKLQEQARLQRLIKERNRELRTPVAARRAEMLREVEAERQRKLKALVIKLIRLGGEVEARKAEMRQLDDIILGRRKDLGLLDQALANRQLLVDQLSEQAMEIVRSKGVTAVACLNCPGYLSVSSMFTFIADMASKIASSDKAAEVPSSTTQTVTKHGDGSG